jgi:hypothetical protein
MSTSEIKPGMKGIGKTVFHGTQIEIFQVDIIDIVKGEGGVSHFILANLSGDKIERGGGISEGMSGSPVYIDDRLIGAVSYAWEMSEHNLCLITPIQDMLEILNLPYGNNQAELQEYKIDNSLYFAGGKTNKIIIKNTVENNSFQELAGREEIIFYPVISPVIISGIRGRSLDRLCNSLKKINLKPVQGVYGIEKIDFQDVGERPSNIIEAGSTIGIQLTRGDVNVVQDREAGILAILNSYPRIIPLKIQVTDVNSGLSYRMGVQMMNDYDLLEPLVSNITVQAIDNALDRIGAGTAQVEIGIKGKKEGQELFRENMYYDSDDIAVQAITEIPEIIDLVVNNYFEMVDLTAININIKIDNKKQKKMLTIQIPSDTSPGEALLMINGGGELDNHQEEFVDNNKKDYKNLEEIFKDISDRLRGNQIIGEVIIYSDELPYGENISDDKPKKEEEEEDLIFSKIETDMVIEGYLEIPFTILED